MTPPIDGDLLFGSSSVETPSNIYIYIYIYIYIRKRKKKKTRKEKHKNKKNKVISSNWNFEHSPRGLSKPNVLNQLVGSY